jgi:light-regulated signal transduction histidine kinase (bacteriophytochrome)
MRAQDLSVMARFPETVGKAMAVGKTAVSQELQAAVQANPVSGSYLAKAGIDGIERDISYHKIGGRPVYVMVGLSTSDTMTDWQRGAMPLVAGLAAFAVLTLAGGAVISRIWRQRLDAHERLQSIVAEQERFSEILAHHLQEPVRIQHIFAQRLKSLLPEPLDREVAVTLDHLLRGATRLRALLRDVRTFLNLGELLDAQPAHCDAEAALSQVLRKLDPQLQEIQARLVIGELPTAPIPEKPFVILMAALLENAIQYRSPDRPLNLRIEGAQTGRQVLFAVTDNGLGIPKHYRERVFNVFERLNPQPDQSGTGIGLAMVRKIVQRSGGWAEITDGENGGICVTLYFPTRST